MHTAASPSPRRALALAAVLALSALAAACAGDAPVGPVREAARSTPLAAQLTGDQRRLVTTLQQATARYKDLDAAKNDGFVFLHGCEFRPEEGPVGIVYINIARLMDGVADPTLPDGLIYEPRGANENPKLAAVEFAIPYPLWTGQEPPKVLNATFQSEDEFGVYGLHVWVWENNPNGLFAESNPRFSCDTP